MQKHLLTGCTSCTNLRCLTKLTKFLGNIWYPKMLYQPMWMWWQLKTKALVCIDMTVFSARNCLAFNAKQDRLLGLVIDVYHKVYRTVLPVAVINSSLNAGQSSRTSFLAGARHKEVDCLVNLQSPDVVMLLLHTPRREDVWAYRSMSFCTKIV